MDGYRFKKRRTLDYATTGLAGVGLGIAMVPFISALIKASYVEKPGVEIEITKLKPGQGLSVTIGSHFGKIHATGIRQEPVTFLESGHFCHLWPVHASAMMCVMIFQGVYINTVRRRRILSYLNTNLFPIISSKLK